MQLSSEQKALIEQLYYEMYPLLCTYAISALSNPQLAEEAVQDTFRIACMKIDSLLASQNAKGWLVNTLKYVIQNIRKSQAKLNNFMMSMLSDEELVTISSTSDVDFQLTYTDLVGAEDFELLKMLVLDQYKMLDASKKLGISVEACKKRVQRAKNKLRHIIKKDS